MSSITPNTPETNPTAVSAAAAIEASGPVGSASVAANSGGASGGQGSPPPANTSPRDTPGGEPSPANRPPPRDVFEDVDLRLAVIQHGLYWVGWTLLLALVLVTIFSGVYVHDIYNRANMFVPSWDVALTKRWYLLAPMVLAWVACFYFRLRRMVEWREAARRPPLTLSGRLYLAGAILALAAVVAPVMAEQVLLAWPSLLGAGRRHLPQNGLYLFSDLSGSGGHALYDYSRPEIGYRYHPNLDLTYFSCGDTIQEKSVSGHLLGRVPYRQLRLKTDHRGFIGFADRPAATADIIALGDSYTHDAIPLRQAWPYLLADHPALTDGRAAVPPSVYNMGIGGCGPQQQWRFVQAYGEELRPRTIVWMFFEGNDLYDSDVWHGSLGKAADRGIPIDEFRRLPKPHDRRWGCSLLRAMVRFAAEGFEGGWPDSRPADDQDSDAPDTPPAKASTPTPEATADGGPTWGPDPWDDDDLAPGVSHLPGGYLSRPPSRYDTRRVLPNRRWAETPLVRTPDMPALNPARLMIAQRPVEMSFYYTRFGLSQEQLTAQPGWASWLATLQQARDYCRANNIRLVFVYAPAKLHVYWPWVAEHVARASKHRGFLGDSPSDRISRYITAQRDLLARTIAAEGVEFIELTGVLRERAATGEMVYLPHDTHWSPIGHQVAAEVIARHLANPPPARSASAGGAAAPLKMHRGWPQRPRPFPLGTSQPPLGRWAGSRFP